MRPYDSERCPEGCLEPDKVVLSLEKRLQYLGAALRDVEHADQIVEFVPRGLLHLPIPLELLAEVGAQFDALLNPECALMQAGAQIEQIFLFIRQRIFHGDLVHVMTPDLHIMIHRLVSFVHRLALDFVWFVVAGLA